MGWCLGMILHPFPLSHFSILGAVRTWGFMGTLIHRHSLKQTVCFSAFINDSVVRFWSCLFVFSKIIELGEWQGLISLAPSQLHPSAVSPLPITWRVPSPPLVLTTPLTQAPLQILCHKNPLSPPREFPLCPHIQCRGWSQHWVVCQL